MSTKNNSNVPEISDEEFYKNRLLTVTEQLKDNVQVYPHKYEVNYRFKDIFTFKDASEEDLKKVKVQSAGRILNFRFMLGILFSKLCQKILPYSLL